MKNHRILFFSLAFFLTTNTSYFWEGKLGSLAIPIFLLLLLIYFILTVVLFRQLYFLFIEKVKNNNRLITVITLTVVLLSIYVKPMGLIDFEKFEASNVLVAEREGSANCLTRFQLKENKTFKLKTVCFGIDEEKGNYFLKNDTIFFVKDGRSNSLSYQFAIIRKSIFSNPNLSHDLVLYVNLSDTSGYHLLISKNQLDKLK